MFTQIRFDCLDVRVLESVCGFHALTSMAFQLNCVDVGEWLIKRKAYFHSSVIICHFAKNDADLLIAVGKTL